MRGKFKKKIPKPYHLALGFMIYCVITQFAERIISTKVKSQSIIALLWDFLFIFAGVMTTTIITGLLIPLLGTMLGSAFVFFMKRVERSPEYCCFHNYMIPPFLLSYKFIFLSLRQK